MASLTISKPFHRPSGCPPGTVPKRRSTKEDLVRLKLLPKFIGEYAIDADRISSPGTHWAVLLSERGTYHGAAAWLEVHNTSGVELNQYSGAAIAILSGAGGPRDNYNAIIAGWFVHPSLYGDNLPRLTVFWTTDGYQKSFCFNHLCSEFQQKSSIYVLGGIAPQGFLPLNLYMDEGTGAWGLSTLNGKNEELIGFWPKSTFTSLSAYADAIQWGGFVHSPPDRKSPPMGNGRFPLYGSRVSQIRVIDEKHQNVDPKGQLFADNRACYDAAWFRKRPQQEWSFLYGGPGGCLGKAQSLC